MRLGTFILISLAVIELTFVGISSFNTKRTLSRAFSELQSKQLTNTTRHIKAIGKSSTCPQREPAVILPRAAPCTHLG